MSHVNVASGTNLPCLLNNTAVVAFLASARQWSERYEGGPQNPEQLFCSWKNNVVSPSFHDVNLANYVLAYSVTEYVYLVETYVEAFTRTFFGLFGLLTTPISLYVLITSKEFSSPSWIYHKTANALDLPGMPFLLYVGLVKLFHLKSVATTYLYYNIAEGVLYLGVMASTPMIFFMSLERTIAVWKPLSFHKINKKWVATSACLFSIAFAAIQWPKLALYNVWLQETNTSLDEVEEGEVLKDYTDIGHNQTLINVGIGCIGIVMLLSLGTIATNVALIVGVRRQAGKMQRRMSIRDLGRQRQTSQICLLCLSVSVPYLLCLVFYGVDKGYLWYFDIRGVRAVSMLTFDEALSHLKHRQWSLICSGLFYLFSCVQHCCHFCFYYWLNQTFRTVVNQTIFRHAEKHKVAPEVVLASEHDLRVLRAASILPLTGRHFSVSTLHFGSSTAETSARQH